MLWNVLIPGGSSVVFFLHHSLSSSFRCEIIYVISFVLQVLLFDFLREVVASVLFGEARSLIGCTVLQHWSSVLRAAPM